MNPALSRIIVLSCILISCGNPLGNETNLDSSFSPGGDATPPSTPSIVSLSGSPTFTTSPTLTWIASTDNTAVTGYEIGIGTSAENDNVVSFSSVGNVTSTQITNINPPLAVSTNYYLLLRAVDSAGNKSPLAASIVWSPGLATENGAYYLPESPTYLADCGDYLSSSYYNNEGSGHYWLDVDGPGGIPAFIGSCDMTTDSGGWTLIMNYVHQGGDNSATSIKTLSLPRITSSTLGDDESDISKSWGHASNNFLTNISYTEMIFYCQTSGHPRVMNFKTSLLGVINYSKTGTGNFSGVENSFTPLSGHTANLPASRDNQFSNQGDNALSAFPMIQSGSAHWGVRASGGRWECDDFPGGNANDTIHRIWVR